MTSEITQIWFDFHAELKGYITKIIKNQTDADDILQEVFIKIIRNHDKVKTAKNMRQYIYGMVRNAVGDYFRNKKHLNTDTEFPDVLTLEDEQFLNATIADCCVKPFINQLPGKYKEALLLTEFQNLSQKDLSERLSISYSGAKSRVQRGKEKLKELLLNCCAYQSDVYGNLMEAEEKNCNCN
ncbi:MAG TPA: sigma-70 family RNA polymerase sigma factor [Bacteroidia bacterium]|nr:sigma-70 family RNA polymerase sigma factor [Bacteroidia bacterium]